MSVKGILLAGELVSRDEVEPKSKLLLGEQLYHCLFAERSYSFDIGKTFIYTLLHLDCKECYSVQATPSWSRVTYEQPEAQKCPVCNALPMDSFQNKMPKGTTGYTY